MRRLRTTSIDRRPSSAEMNSSERTESPTFSKEVNKLMELWSFSEIQKRLGDNDLADLVSLYSQEVSLPELGVSPVKKLPRKESKSVCTAYTMSRGAVEIKTRKPREDLQENLISHRPGDVEKAERTRPVMIRPFLASIAAGERITSRLKSYTSPGKSPSTSRNVFGKINPALNY